MTCAWMELLRILPPGIRDAVDRLGRNTLQELRLRINAPPELVLSDDRRWLSEAISQEELDFVINTATKYSPWTASSVSEGYITAPGGHRIGICGEVVWKNGSMAGFRKIRSLCIRVARDFPGIGKAVAALNGSLLILGPPGSGKTTLLRDVIRQLANWKHIVVVDERCELFPEGFGQGQLQDTLIGCRKERGIEIVLRTMGPEMVAVDEITEEADCQALIRAANCGVDLVATAHAGSLEDFCKRGVYCPLREAKLFRDVILLNQDKTYTVERMSA